MKFYHQRSTTDSVDSLDSRNHRFHPLPPPPSLPAHTCEAAGQSGQSGLRRRGDHIESVAHAKRLAIHTLHPCHLADTRHAATTNNPCTQPK